MDIKRLLQLGERAKALGNDDYSLPNAAFAGALYEFFKNQCRVGGVVLEIETQNAKGDTPLCEYEAYYDLVCIRAGEESLCAPLPLLSTLTTASVFKAGVMVPRKRHSRPSGIASPKEREVLWAELLEEVERDHLQEALFWVFSEDHNVSVPSE